MLSIDEYQEPELIIDLGDNVEMVDDKSEADQIRAQMIWS